MLSGHWTFKVSYRTIELAIASDYIDCLELY